MKREWTKIRAKVKGFIEEEIDKILNGNILRVWKAVKEFAKNT